MFTIISILFSLASKYPYTILSVSDSTINDSIGYFSIEFYNPSESSIPMLFGKKGHWLYKIHAPNHTEKINEKDIAVYGPPLGTNSSIDSSFIETFRQAADSIESILISADCYDGRVTIEQISTNDKTGKGISISHPGWALYPPPESSWYKVYQKICTKKHSSTKTINKKKHANH